MICAYIRHIYACGTISPTTRCQSNILCKSTPPLTIQLCKSTPPFTFLIWLDMIYDAWTYKERPNNAKHSTYTSTNNNVKVHLHLHWPTSTTIALSTIYVHTLSTNIHINRHIYVIYILININYIIWLHDFIHFLTIQVKEKIQHFMINIIFNTQQSFTYPHLIIWSHSRKIFKVLDLKDHFWQGSSLILQL